MSFNSVTGYLTGGLIDPVAPDYAGAATKAEKTRQALINQGISDINAVFSGGSTTKYDPALNSPFNPRGGYYKLGPKGFRPYVVPGAKQQFSFGGLPGGAAGLGLTFAGPLGGALGGSIQDFAGGNPSKAGLSAATGGATDILGSIFGGSPETPTQHLKKGYEKGLLYTATPETYKGFGPDFFNQAAQSYVNFAMPQFAKQYRDTSDAMRFGLENRGLSGSSQARKAGSDLNVQTGLGEQQIVDTARQTSQGLQKSVEDARNQAVNLLYQTADPSQALQQSISAASGFAVPQTFAPLSNVFSNLANQYAINQTYNPQGLGGVTYLNPYQLFGQSMPTGQLGQTAQYGY